MSRIMDRPEEDWDAASAAAIAELRRWLIDDAGQSVAFANGLVGHLFGRKHGQETAANTSTLARYRKVLREYGPPNGSPGTRRRATSAPWPPAQEP